MALHSSLHASLSSTFQDLDLLDQKGLEELEQIDPLRKQTVAWYRASRDRLKGHYTREQLAQILSLDCDFAQGYLFSRPLGSVEAEAACRDTQRWRIPA